MPAAARHAGFGGKEFFIAHCTGTIGFRKTPHVVGAYVMPAVFARKHGAARNHYRWQVYTTGTHYKREGGFIAAAHHYNTIDLVGPDGFLHTHPHQISVE